MEVILYYKNKQYKAVVDYFESVKQVFIKLNPYGFFKERDAHIFEMSDLIEELRKNNVTIKDRKQFVYFIFEDFDGEINP